MSVVLLNAHEVPVVNDNGEGARASSVNRSSLSSWRAFFYVGKCRVSLSFIPEFSPLCCDAGDYIEFGNRCALDGVCYGDLRPGGAYYWFSWPVRMGLPSEALILSNAFLFLLSSFFSVCVLRLICASSRGSLKRNIFSSFFFFVASAVIHGIYFSPTISTSLSDPPAALFLLNGIWLLLLAAKTVGARQILCFFSAGILLGVAAWIRAFYLYPVLVGLLVCCIAAVIGGRRNLTSIFILGLLIPIGIQFHDTYSRTGNLAYLSSDTSSDWINTHLKSRAVGYDTVFQNQGFISESHYCEARVGILDAIDQLDFSSAFCLIGNRAGFYLATYRPMNYIYPDIKNQLFTEAIEDIGDNCCWAVGNIDRQADVAADPMGGMTADKLSVSISGAASGGYVSQWVFLPANSDYTFSVWLWSDVPVSVILSFKRTSDDALLASSTVKLSSQPQRFFISGKTIGNGNYSVVLGVPSLAMPEALDAASNSFYAWGAQLEHGSEMTEYAGKEVINGDSVRTWRLWMLAANGFAICMASLFMIRNSGLFLYEPAGITAVAIIGMVSAVALAIIPEQRFGVSFMVFIWLLATGQLYSMICNRFISRSDDSLA